MWLKYKNSTITDSDILLNAKDITMLGVEFGYSTSYAEDLEVFQLKAYAQGIGFIVLYENQEFEEVNKVYKELAEAISDSDKIIQIG